MIVSMLGLFFSPEDEGDIFCQNVFQWRTWHNIPEDKNSLYAMCFDCKWTSPGDIHKLAKNV
jgi:hypothetical protein